MGNNEQTAIRLLKDLVSLQNGAPLERDKEEYDKLMNEIYSFLNDIADREIIESVFNSHSPTEPEFDTLQEGDWFQGTEEQYNDVFRMEKVWGYDEKSELWAASSFGHGFLCFDGTILCWIKELKKTQLTPGEFLRRAENTFKTK